MKKSSIGIFIALMPVIAAAASGDVPIANPPSVKIERVVGSSSMPGLYILHSRLPADGVVPPHQHTVDHHIAVLSGTLYVCNSSIVSTATTVAHKAGDFFVEPANIVHCSWAKDGPVDYIEIGQGPSTTTFAK